MPCRDSSKPSGFSGRILMLRAFLLEISHTSLENYGKSRMSFMWCIVFPQVCAWKPLPAVSHTIIVFGDKFFKEVTKWKWGCGRPSSNLAVVLIRQENLHRERQGCAHSNKTVWATRPCEHTEKGIVYKPRRDAFGESNLAITLTLDF